MVSELFTIDDLLLGESREIIIYSGALVLCPEYNFGVKSFSNNIAYLGAVEKFGKIQEKPFVKLEPFYKIIMQEDGRLDTANVRRLRDANSLYANFFKTIFAGNARAIVQALRNAPFSKMEQLADAVQKLQYPYSESLENFFENRKRELARTG
jgi:hypothetical protein